MADARWTSAKRFMDEILECPVCMQEQVDPRSLPCVHSFCLSCINGVCQGKEPRTRVPCPVCRKKFSIPHGGVGCLPRNYVLERLKEMSKTEADRSLCEDCTDGSVRDSAAVQFCVECDKRLCETCVHIHRLIETTGSHNLYKIGENVSNCNASLTATYEDKLRKQTHATCTNNNTIDTVTPNISDKQNRVSTLITSTAPTSIQVLPAGYPVAGVTSLANRLFVVRFPSQRQIEVYDTETFILQRTLHVSGLSDDGDALCGLASCAVNACIYVSDCDRATVHKIELTGDNKTSKWRVDDEPRGLSVNSACNVLVTCSSRRPKIQEYTARGSLVREVRLQSYGISPFHAVQLTTGQFVVSNWEPMYDIFLVDKDGKVLASFSSRCNSMVTAAAAATRLNEPRCLVVDKNDCIFVADCGNDRILVLDSTLNNSHDIPVNVESGLKGPWCLHLDESRGRLYVGEYLGRRVLRRFLTAYVIGEHRPVTRVKQPSIISRAITLRR